MWQGIKNIYHLANAILANLWFGFPSRSLTVIGVTGTDGKTTTVSLIYHILHTAGYNASMISSVGAIIGGKNYDVGFHVTTPSPWSLQNFIKKAVGYLVLETTSHALDQHRVFGIKFDVGVLTNVTHEHLDYHKSYESYVATKARLLTMARVAIVNRDDHSYELISNLKTASFAKASAAKQNSKTSGFARQLKTQKLITYGMGMNSDINPKKFPFKTNLIGEFNKYNILAAVGVCKALGISDQDIKRAIQSFNPPIGREEIVYKNSFTVMVDFAHTPNAFEQILSSLRPSTKGRLIHVFGSAGERDRSKRPLMGKASAKYSNVIILTSEDPRSEPVEKIMEEVEKGIFNFQFFPQSGIPLRGTIFNENNKLKNNKKYLFKISNRQEAINTAIKMARKGDFVLITGKAHEKSMNYGRGEEPWDEFEAVKKALRLRSG